MTGNTSSKTTVLNDVEITGSITFKGTLYFEGKLRKGSIAGDTLFVGKSADIKGNIMADSLHIDGKVFGNITAMETCGLGMSAMMIGDLTSTRVAMAEGATLIGQMQIGPDAERLKPKPKLHQTLSP